MRDEGSLHIQAGGAKEIMNNNIRRKSGAIWISGKIRGGWERADEVVPIHLKYPLEKIYNFIEVGSSSSNWRLALAQAEPGSQHQGWVPLGELGALGVMGRLGTLGALAITLQQKPDYDREDEGLTRVRESKGLDRGNGQEGGESDLSKLHLEGLCFGQRKIGVKFD
ncbi:hypothetical protein MMC31_007033 [Peltigera leucophlebia]|nr:hypothetical protein [Peltigera leucophlebia]